MRMIVYKELREVAGIAAAALACYLALVVSLMGGRVFSFIPLMPSGTHAVPFTDSGFSTPFMFITAGFALALGFRQSAWEAVRGTYLFLLHRPVQRDWIFLIKLATGTAVLMLVGSVPIVAYAWWAAVPGHHPSPFQWAMTGSAWELLLGMPILYLGAFLSGLRPARWYGTRLLPLLGCLLLCVLRSELSETWFLALSVPLVLCGLLAGCVCHVARVRDYA
ncbi:MAG TPA: hypothetical protein VFA18_12785 [Gemmataceae bacterium]|nr:hypothetical protein [Gemmataceae bacterium]